MRLKKILKEHFPNCKVEKYSREHYFAVTTDISNLGFFGELRKQLIKVESPQDIEKCIESLKKWER